VQSELNILRQHNNDFQRENEVLNQALLTANKRIESLTRFLHESEMNAKTESEGDEHKFDGSSDELLVKIQEILVN
jgi:hypothetical protein